MSLTFGRSIKPCRMCRQNKKLLVLFPCADSYEYLNMTKANYLSRTCSICGWLGVERKQDDIPNRNINRIIYFLYRLLGW